MAATLVLVLGLFISLGSHSVRIVADDWRSAQIARMGEQRWKALYSLVSLIGIGLVVWGYGLTRADPVALWMPPVWTRHLASLLTLPAFLLLVAAYVPGNRLKTAVGHPMIAGVGLWALAHLPANGNLGDLLLFGSFLIWAALSFRAARRRDSTAARGYPAGPLSRTLIAATGGILAWAVFALMLHGPLIGVRPFG